jgi:hypothetical protein
MVPAAYTTSSRGFAGINSLPAADSVRTSLIPADGFVPKSVVADGGRGMSETCPHCGAEVSAGRDAFCPNCRNALNEPPAAPNAPDQSQAEGRSSGTLWLVIGWLMIVGPLAASANPQQGPHGRPEACVDVGFILAGIVLLSRQPEVPGQHAGQSEAFGG